MSQVKKYLMFISCILITTIICCSGKEGGAGAPGTEGVQGPQGEQGPEGPQGPEGSVSAVITGIMPSEVKCGSEVTIIGFGFGDTRETSVISFGDAEATEINSWSNTMIDVLLPTDADTGIVAVTVDGLVSSPGFVSLLWTQENPDNVPVCTDINSQSGQQITSDGTDGAIITWEDLRNGGFEDFFAQRIRASGAVQWTADGIWICFN